VETILLPPLKQRDCPIFKAVVFSWALDNQLATAKLRSSLTHGGEKRDRVCRRETIPPHAQMTWKELHTFKWRAKSTTSRLFQEQQKRDVAIIFITKIRLRRNFAVTLSSGQRRGLKGLLSTASICLRGSDPWGCPGSKRKQVLPMKKKGRTKMCQVTPRGADFAVLCLVRSFPPTVAGEVKLQTSKTRNQGFFRTPAHHSVAEAPCQGRANILIKSSLAHDAGDRP